MNECEDNKLLKQFFKKLTKEQEEANEAKAL
jgi:hypothetical protein